MHILVTNDDGVWAPGLQALAHEMERLGDVTILAPDHNWSASGHVKTLNRPLRVSEVRLDDGTSAWASDGAPSDCVALALLGLLPIKFDLVVSGINPFANISHDVTYSGTVTAAMEAAIWGLPALAVSLHSPENHVGPLEYGPAARAARHIAETMLVKESAGNLLLNVNVPYLQDEQIKGYTLTRQGMRIYRDELVRRLDPRNRPYYWIGGDAPTGVNEEGTDFGALESGYVSITPLKLDLTDYQALESLKAWKWKNNP